MHLGDVGFSRTGPGISRASAVPVADGLRAGDRRRRQHGRRPGRGAAGVRPVPGGVDRGRRDRRRAPWPAGDAVPRRHQSESVPECDAAVLAVKPPDVAGGRGGGRRRRGHPPAVDRRRRPRWRPSRRRRAPAVAVVRAMPNTPALVGKGRRSSPAAASAGRRRPRWAEARPRRRRHGRPSRTRITSTRSPPFTGSGPAYLFLVAEALIDAGVDGRAAARRSPRARRRSCSSARRRCSPSEATPPRCGRW